MNGDNDEELDKAAITTNRLKKKNARSDDLKLMKRRASNRHFLKKMSKSMHLDFDVALKIKDFKVKLDKEE